VSDEHTTPRALPDATGNDFGPDANDTVTSRPFRSGDDEVGHGFRDGTSSGFAGAGAFGADRSPADRADAEADDDSPAGKQYGIGPFTVREIALLAVWLVAFIVSFFSVWVESPVSSALLSFGSVWSSGIDWILTIGVPTVAVFLIVLRRFSPDGIRRVGSLAVDQFASVAFSVSAVIWLGILWTNIARAIQTGLWLNSWVVWVEFFLMVAGVFLTVLAPFIQPFDEDFRGRPDVNAHRNARPVRPVVSRPSSPRPAPSESAYAPRDTSFEQTAAFAPFEEEQAVVEPAPSATQAFWALSPVERDVVDESGVPLFTVGPAAWALVIEDRGDTFVVRHEDGRVGYLTDVSGVTRG
jgi:hypothetical protein